MIKLIEVGHCGVYYQREVEKPPQQWTPYLKCQLGFGVNIPYPSIPLDFGSSSGVVICKKVAMYLAYGWVKGGSPFCSYQPS